MFDFCKALLDCLPTELKTHAAQIIDDDKSKEYIEDILRFASGCNQSLKPTNSVSSEPWTKGQRAWQDRIQSLGVVTTNGTKRPLENADGTLNNVLSAKKAKVEPAASDSVPLYTLHGVSCTSPARRKLDITIGSSFITFVNPTSSALEATIPFSRLGRAFLLHTPGKTKPHYTVVMMGNQRASNAKPTAGTSNDEQIIFGLDATTAGAFKTTAHTPTSKTETHPKNTSTLELILEFISHLPADFSVHDTSRSTFRSNIDKSECGVTAYLRAKEGHLYFFNEGILFGEKKPCLWFPVEEISAAKIWSVTGKTATMHIDSGGAEDGEKEEETIEFGTVDGREMEVIRRWISSAEPRFGSISTSDTHASKNKDIKAPGNSQGAASAKDSAEEEDMKAGVDEEEESDEDFAIGSGESDGGEPSSDSGSGAEDSEGGEQDDDEDESSAGDESSEDQRVDNAQENKKTNEGMRISSAAANVAVKMVMEDLAAASEEVDELADD